jgi:hypothetical protein
MSSWSQSRMRVLPHINQHLVLLRTLAIGHALKHCMQLSSKSWYSRAYTCQLV